METYDGSAWMGVVPFAMSGVRLSGLFPVPFLDRFLELNLRTYVRDRHGRRGVWFFSLEANHTIAVAIARRFFHLNYQRAHFQQETVKEHELRLQVKRVKGDHPVVHLHYKREPGNERQAPPGSLEAFLVERYRLFSQRRRDGCLGTCEIHHAPYQLVPARVFEDGRALFAVNGFDVPEAEPDHVIAALPVDVVTDRIRCVKEAPEALAQSSAVAAS